MTAGIALRVITSVGFPPAIWFAGDSIVYVNTALTHVPSISRQSGYSLFLLLLQPLHSFAVVTALQHAMGLAMGVMIFALLRRHGLPRWGAALATAPVLLDAYEIQLEQEMLPDVLFAFLVIAAVTLLGWWKSEDRPLWAAPAATAMLGYAAVCWPVGLPLLIIAVVVLIIKRAGWKAVTAGVLAGAVPLVMYLGWYDRAHNRIAFNNSSGVFLWSRTMTFADCAVIKPPPAERVLCPNQPLGHRMSASLWIWNKHSPIQKASSVRFTPEINTLAGNFARRAILAQPLDYAHAVVDSFALTFTWDRPPHPNKGLSRRYQFGLAWRNWDHGTPRSVQIILVQREYTGGHLAGTHMVHPWSTFMIAYQKVMYLRGTMVGILLLLGLGAVVRSWLAAGYRRRRDFGGPALLPFLTGLAILLVPPITADFSLRYVVPAIPAVTLAAAYLFLRARPADEAQPPKAEELPDEDDDDKRISTGPLPAQT
ncbi:MAG TPA: hypothetical protein VFV41_23870 [Streptosporangiaceae bacterium]|nr:hypothetical protein [Streptosporangiaceae bacterium]